MSAGCSVWGACVRANLNYRLCPGTWHDISAYIHIHVFLTQPTTYFDASITSWQHQLSDDARGAGSTLCAGRRGCQVYVCVNLHTHVFYFNGDHRTYLRNVACISLQTLCAAQAGPSAWTTVRAPVARSFSQAVFLQSLFFPSVSPSLFLLQSISPSTSPPALALMQPARAHAHGGARAAFVDFVATPLPGLPLFPFVIL